MLPVYWLVGVGTDENHAITCGELADLRTETDVQRGRTMAENDPVAAEAGGNPGERRSDARTPRGIRFSDSEWERVKLAAAEQNIPAAEFVRNAALGPTGGKTGAGSVVLTPGHAALIERIYRGVYLLSTLKRGEIVRDRRRNELDLIMKEARESQASILGDILD